MAKFQKEEMTQPKQYYRVREASAMLGVPSSTLRYWESEFPELNPSKTMSGQRLYTPEDIELIKRIMYLLHEKKMALRGAKEVIAATYRKQPVRHEHVCNTPKDALRILRDLKKAAVDGHSISRIEALEKWAKSIETAKIDEKSQNQPGHAHTTT